MDYPIVLTLDQLHKGSFTGRQGRQSKVRRGGPNASYRSDSPLPLVANIVKELTIFAVSSPEWQGHTQIRATAQFASTRSRWSLDLCERVNNDLR